MNMSVFLVMAMPQLVIAGCLVALILLVCRQPFPFRWIVRTALIGATVFTVLVGWFSIYSILTSPPPMAGIGYIALPFISAATALVSFAVIAALLYSVRFLSDSLGWTRKITTLWLGVPALLVVALACLVVTLRVSRARLLAEAKSASNVVEINTLLESAVKHSDIGILAMLARNPNAPTETLERINKIAMPRDIVIKWALADNPHTPQNILSEFVSSANEQLIVAVAANPNTPAETVNQLANRPDYYVQRIVTAHPKISVENLQLLAYDQDKNLREAALLNLQRRGLPHNAVASEEICRILANRSVQGDLSAVDDLAEIAAKTQASTAPTASDGKAGEPLMTMFEFLGECAAAYSSSMTALEYAATKPALKPFVIRAYARAASEGSDSAVTQLWNCDAQGWDRASVIAVMQSQAGQNSQPAVEFLQQVLTKPEFRPCWDMAIKGLEGAAARGNAAAAATVADYKQRTASP